MTEMAENRNTVETEVQQSGHVSMMFRCYWDNFWLFWRIMIPLIFFSVAFEIVGNSSEAYFGSEDLWHFDTARGLVVGKHPKSTGVYWGAIFRFHSLSFGWLWLTVCPLAFVIVQHYRGIKVRTQRVWVEVRGKVISIFGASVLLSLLAIIGYFAFLVLTSRIIPNIPASPYGSSVCLGLCLIMGVVVYFGVNWSLYNQSLIIEDRTAIDAMRRSSTLVRGVWGRAAGMYLLLGLMTMLFTSVCLGLTLLVFSVTVREFAPLREILFSEKFFTLFFGGYARISFESAPSFWTVGVIVIVNTLVHAVLIPV